MRDRVWAAVAIASALVELVALGLGERQNAVEQFVWPSCLIVWVLLAEVRKP